MGLWLRSIRSGESDEEREQDDVVGKEDRGTAEKNSSERQMLRRHVMWEESCANGRVRRNLEVGGGITTDRLDGDGEAEDEEEKAGQDFSAATRAEGTGAERGEREEEGQATRCQTEDRGADSVVPCTQGDHQCHVINYEMACLAYLLNPCC